MKKKLVAGLLAGVMVLGGLMTGCGNSSNSSSGGSDSGSESASGSDSGSSAASGDAVELTFSWWGSDDRHNAMQEVIKLYEEANPNVKINIEYGAWDGWQTKILTQLSGKTEADIMQVNYNWVHSFGQGSNVFYNLNDLSDNIELSNWDQNYLDSMTVGGELGAVPHGMTGRVEMYNKKLFDDAGLTFPKTFDEVKDAAAVLGADNTATGAENKYVLLNVGEVSTDLFIAQMLYNKTGKVMQTDGKVNYSVEEVQEILDLYKSLEDAGAIPTFAQQADMDNESDTNWTSGRSGAVYEWAGTLDKFVGSITEGGLTEDELAIGNYITEDGTAPSVYVKPNLGYAVSKNSKNPEVAADFINFMFTDEGAVKALGTSLGISSNTVTYGIQEAEGMITGKVKEAYELLDTYDQTVMDPYFEDSNVRGERYTAIEAFRTGASDSKAAAEAYVNKQQEALDTLYE